MVDFAFKTSERWSLHVHRTPEGAPVIPARFVLEQGSSLQLIDVQRMEEGIGPAGYIAGSVFVPPEHLASRLSTLPPDTPVVIVSGRGDLAATLAKRVEQECSRPVAALEGGLAAWRRLGLRTSRDPAGIHAALAIAPPPHSATGPLSLEDVRQHIGDPRSVQWIKAVDLVGHGRLSCVDGRDERGVIGTPGGDAGEFLVMAAALEETHTREFGEAMLREALLRRFDLFGDFYLHTDATAVDALSRALRSDPRLETVLGADASDRALTAFFRRPPAPLRGVLLEHVTAPAHIGCGHVRLMMEHAESYGTRRGLVEAFLRAVYTLYWEGAPELHLTSLPGRHREGAVVDVRLTEDIWAMTWVPLVSPSYGGRQMFVNHSHAAAFVRNASIEWLRRADGPIAIDDGRAEVLRESIERLATRQLTQTLDHLAKGLPIYELTFTDEGLQEVRSAGVVPG